MNPLKAVLAVLLASTLFLAGCQTGPEGWERVDVEEFKTQIETNEGAFLLDVRSLIEYEDDGHIDGAYLIPHTSIEDRADELPEDKDTTILLYCRSGNRSQTAAESLLDFGYTDVRDLESGIIGWKDAGEPVVYGA